LLLERFGIEKPKGLVIEKDRAFFKTLLSVKEKGEKGIVIFRKGHITDGFVSVFGHLAKRYVINLSLKDFNEGNFPQVEEDGDYIIKVEGIPVKAAYAKNGKLYLVSPVNTTFTSLQPHLSQED